MTNYMIRDLNNDEKPREKAIKLGLENLTDSELLALVLRSGGKGISVIELARNLLEKFGGLSGIARTDISQLSAEKNIDVAKVTSLKSSFEIGIRLSNTKSDQRVLIKTPKDVFDVMKKDLFGKTKEHLYLICLNSRNKLVSKDLLSIGSINETLLNPREIFKQAFLRNAAAMILVHNHPSGDTAPSKEDIEITSLIAGSAKSVGIPLVDHVIVSDNDFSSLKSLNLFSTYKFES